MPFDLVSFSFDSSLVSKLLLFILLAFSKPSNQCFLAFSYIFLLAFRVSATSLFVVLEIRLFIASIISLMKLTIDFPRLVLSLDMLFMNFSSLKKCAEPSATISSKILSLLILEP